MHLLLGLAAAVGLALFVSQLAEIPFRSALRGYDNTFNYLWLRSAMVDGDWDFRNDLAAGNTLTPDHRAAALALPPTEAGRIPNKYGLGWAVLTLPFYLGADAFVALGRATGLLTLERDGFSAPYQVAVQTGHALLAVLALVLATRTIGRWLDDRRAALAGVAAVWAASPLLYYQTVNLSMSHGAAFSLIAVLAFALERATATPADAAPGEPLRVRWWLLAGAALGLAAITRFQLAVFGVVVLWATGRDWRTITRLALVAAGAAPFVLLQLWAWRVVYGRWLVFSYGVEGEGFHWSRPELANSLFSPWHGLFYWHPFLLVALAGLFAWAWTRRGAAIAWSGAVALTLYVNAAWWCWWFASAFGNRGFDAALLPVMAGAAWLFHRARGPWRTALGTLAVGAAAWNVYLVLLYRTGAISRHAPLTWEEMLAAAARLPDALRF